MPLPAPASIKTGPSVVLTASFSKSEQNGIRITVETILNRIISNKYPNTLVEVLSQSGQFGTWKHITTTKAIPTFDTYQCVAMVLVGQTNVLSYDSLHFNNRPIGNNPVKIGNQYYGK